MKILLSGVETNNKGAELMLYAILQEIERKYPDAEVFIPAANIRQGVDYVKTSLKLSICQQRFVDRIIGKLHINGILRRLHLPQITPKLIIPEGIEYFIDGSGFTFSDQCKLPNWRVEYWRNLLVSISEQKCRVAFLPQAFGPAELPNTKTLFSILNDYASVIMPREKVSFDYIERSGVVDMKKVLMFTDFTSLVEGTFPRGFETLKNGICVIPNMRMIDKGVITKEDYKKLLGSIIEHGKRTGHTVYLLNHEGKGDEDLAFELKKDLAYEIEVVTGLNALEIKGLISTAYIVISSRFHGVASALNSCVPCLATSWSHKYWELFIDYKMFDCVLPLDDLDKVFEMVDSFLEEDNNSKIRSHLTEQLSEIQRQTKEMWKQVWGE